MKKRENLWIKKKKEFALKRCNQLPYLDFNSKKQILKVNK